MGTVEWYVKVGSFNDSYFIMFIYRESFISDVIDTKVNEIQRIEVKEHPLKVSAATPITLILIRKVNRKKQIRKSKKLSYYCNCN